MFEIDGVKFAFSTLFNSSDIAAMESSLTATFSGANVDGFLHAYNGETIYITPYPTPTPGDRNAEYFGTSQSLQNFSFYGDNQTIVNAPSTAISIGISKILLEGYSITNAGTSGPFYPSVSRIFFHELAHGVTLSTAPNFVTGDQGGNGYFGSPVQLTDINTNFSSAETLAVASENLLYAKDHQQPSRVGHGNYLAPSYDPAISFRHVSSVLYQRIAAVPGGTANSNMVAYSNGSSQVAAEFSGDTSDGTIRKDYWQDGYVPAYAASRIPLPFTSLYNYITVNGDASADLVSTNGTLSETSQDVLSGIAADSSHTSKALKTASADLTFLKSISNSLLQDPGLNDLSSALTGISISDPTRITGLSDEADSESGSHPIVGPYQSTGILSNGDYAAKAATSLFIGSDTVGAILVGASGFVGKDVNFSSRTDFLVGSNSQGSVLVAGSGARNGSSNLLVGGDQADVLIGGSKNDRIEGGAGDDIILQSAGTDDIDGGSGLNTLVLSDSFGAETVDMTNVRALRSVLSGGAGSNKYTTELSNVQIIVGNKYHTKFIGNGHSIFIAGSGGGDFTLKSGDVAIGDPDSTAGNVYRVTTQDIVGGHVAILNFGKNDKLIVDGKTFNGSTAYAMSLGESYNSNHDTPGNMGVLNQISSSWGASVTQPHLYDTFGELDDSELRQHLWTDGAYPDGAATQHLRDVTYVKSSGSTGGSAGDIYFTDQSMDQNGNRTTNTSFDISLSGWQQGFGGIKFLENNLARDAVGSFSIGGGPDGWSGAVLGGSGNAGPSWYAGYYNLNGVETAVGNLFDPNSDDWQTGGDTWDQIDQMILADEQGTTGGDLPDGNPFGGGDSGGNGGGPGPIGDVPGDDNEGTGAPLILNGTSGADILDPQGAGYKIVGKGGGDTIIYNPGYGITTIDEEDNGSAPNNILQFGTGIAPADIVVSATPSGDIILALAGADEVILQGALNSETGLARGVQQVTFSDGTTWSYADLLALVETPAGAGSTIYGDTSANTLDTAGLATTAVGGGGGDTFLFNAGYGDVTIDERDGSGVVPNVLSFGAGINPSSANVYGQSDGSLVIDFGDGDKVTIANALLSTSDMTYGVQEIDFADGTSWSYSDLLSMADTASSSNLALYGDRSSNYLWGGGLATSLTGGGGGDTFEVDNGDQPVTIYESDTSTTPDNALDLYGFSPSDITVRADAQGNLLLIANGVVQITIANALNSANGVTEGVQQVVFDDGTTWSYSDLLSMADTAASDNTTLYGDGSANTFDPAGIATSIVGGGGGDTFLYDRGYGALSITETDTDPGAANVLQFGTGISAGDVSVTADDAGDLILSLGDGDTITLVGALASSAGILNGVQSVAFADGTSWTYADLLQKVLTPTTSGSTIYGDSGANTLDSQGIASIDVGNGGGDTFVYDTGYGALTIEEQDEALTPNNVLAFGSGIDPNNISVSATTDGAIVLSLGGSDVITLADALLSDGMDSYGIQTVTFADGTSWSYADLLAKVSTASAGGATTIFGDGSANTLDPGGIASTVMGGGGEDTILFNQGYGVVTVEEQDFTSDADNVLQFGTGIDAANVTVSANASADIILDAGGGDQVILKKALDSTDGATYGVQEIDFADGSTWSYDDLLAKVDTPSSTNTTLYGDTGSNTLDGAGMANLLVGGGGDDSFVFNQGYGALTIDEQDAAGSPDNKLVLGTGIFPDAVSVSANAAGDLILALGGSDQITLKGALNSDQDMSYGVQEVDFADGTVWSYDDLLAKADTPTTSNTTLYGDAYANDFDSAGIAHTIVGRGGGDSFTYDRGYGALTIDDQDSGDDPSNTLAFGAEIAPSDVTVSTTAAGDIQLSLGNDDVVTLLGAATATPGVARGVQQVTFEGGLSWSGAQLQALASGSWTIADDGQQTDIDEAVNYSSSAPVIDLDFGSTDTSVTLGDDRNSIILTSVNGTTVTIDDLLRKGVGEAQSIHFSDGVTWSLAQAASNASNVADVINYEVGTPSAEDFDFANGVQEAIGGGGGDSFRYESGDGYVTLYEADQTGAADNVLNFGPGISLSDLTVTSDGSDLYLAMANGDEVVISNAVTSDDQTTYGVQSVSFADGTSATYQQLLQMADTGSPTNDGTLYGDANGNVIDPAGWAHYVMGGGGSDTVIYGQGYGNLEIEDYSQSPGSDATIAFRAGISPSDIDIEAGSDGSYANGMMTISVDGSTISIDNELSSATPIIDRLTFADGTVMNYADMLVAMETPVAGKTEIAGDFSANTLDTQGIVHQADGNGGGDTFIYNRGYGALKIVEYDGSATPSNRVLFGAGIDPADVSVTLTYQGAFQLDLGNGDVVTVQCDQGDPEGVQSVQFADGTIWSPQDLLEQADTGTPRKASIYGTNLSETFDSRGYTSYINGEGGSDTYIFDPGYGALTIGDISYYGADTNILQFGAGIDPSDVVVAKSGQNVILSVGASDRVILSNQLSSGSGYQNGVEQVTFADGTVWSAATLQTMVNATPSGSAAVIDAGSDVVSSVVLPVSTDDALAMSGTIGFTDADNGDTHSVSVVGVSYTDPSYPNLPSTTQMLDYLSASITGEPGASGEGSIAWSFNAPSSVFDALSPGETVDLHFSLQIQDQNHAVTTQDLVVSISAGVDGNPATVHIAGTSGDDTLYLNSNFVADPGTGNDTLYAGAYGGGTFQFAKGDGNDDLIDNDWWGNRTDSLKLTDANPDEVSLARNGDALTVTIDATGDSFTADDQFSGSTTGLSQIVFTDGSVWDRDEITNRVNSNTVAMDTPDQAYDASDGPDTFVLSNDMGHASIASLDLTGTQHDYVEVNRNMFSDWAHLLGATQQQGSDLVINVDSSNSVDLAGVSLASFTQKDVKFTGMAA